MKDYIHRALRNASPDLLFKSKGALPRLAQPEEVAAAAVAFLVSDDASFVISSTLADDEGDF